MKITVKTTGLLGRYLPAGADGVTELEVASDATAADVIELLGMPPEGTYLVVLNGASVARREHASRALSEGDVLAIMPPLRGG